MTPEKMFKDLLGLGLNWEVVESRFEKESGTVFLEIRETSQLWESVRCPKDGGLVFCHDQVEEMTWRHLNVFQHRCSQACCVGVDEMSVHKGHQYITVFADLVVKRVLFATEGKDKETWMKFVETLEQHNGHRHAITQASMDIAKPIRLEWQNTAGMPRWYSTNFMSSNMPMKQWAR